MDRGENGKVREVKQSRRPDILPFVFAAVGIGLFAMASVLLLLGRATEVAGAPLLAAVPFLLFAVWRVARTA